MKFHAIFIRWILRLGSLSFFMLMATGLVISVYFKELSRQSFLVHELVVEIPFGSSLRRVSNIIEEAGLIDDSRRFYWYLRLGRMDGDRIQAGYYQFSGDVSYREIAERLLFGFDRSHKVTFKEGQTLVDLAQVLSDLDLVSQEEFLRAMKSEEILRAINAPDAYLRSDLINDMGGIEGYLFPDTYFFTKKDDAPSIIKKMHQKLLNVFDENMVSRMADEGFTMHEVLTLASIVEKETAAPSERPIIASVYRNRLKRGMRLQADPTVIYGIKNYAGKIRKVDLLTHHPYNTYTITGLPPGPIAACGLDSIRAVLWPSATKFLFFVSKNDGTHVFCEDLACHNRAVDKWQVQYFRQAAQRTEEKNR